MRTTRRTCSSICTTTPPIRPTGAPSRSSRCFPASELALRSSFLAPLAVLALTACDLERVAIPRTEAQVALHGVLSASAPTQVVLLERTRNRSIRPFAPPFDLGDPVV